MGPFGPKQPAAGTPPSEGELAGEGLLGQKTFLGALGDGIPRPEVAQQQGGGGVVVPVVLPGLLWGFVGVAVFAAVEAGIFPS